MAAEFDLRLLFVAAAFASAGELSDF